MASQGPPQIVQILMGHPVEVWNYHFLHRILNFNTTLQPTYQYKSNASKIYEDLLSFNCKGCR